MHGLTPTFASRTADRERQRADRRRKTYKLTIGGCSRAPNPDAAHVVRAADDSPGSSTPCGPPAGSPRRGPGGPRRVPGLVRQSRWCRRSLYRVAELMEGRRDQFVAEVDLHEGLREAKARGSRGEGD